MCNLYQSVLAGGPNFCGYKDQTHHPRFIWQGAGAWGSTLTSLLGLKLASNGHKVGVLDIELCGPPSPTARGPGNEGAARRSGVAARTDARPWIPTRHVHRVLPGARSRVARAKENIHGESAA